MGKKKPTSKRSKTRQPKKEAFLAAYAKCGVLTQAAREAGCNRNQHYRWLEDEDYKERFDAAHEAACDAIEEEIRRRAILGYEEPVFYQGEQVATVLKFSDTLLIFAAKGAMPDKYRERLDLRANIDQNTTIGVVLDDDFYETAVALRAEASAPSTGSSDAPGAKQGRRVRKALGQNGNGANGNGPRSRKKQ